MFVELMSVMLCVRVCVWEGGSLWSVFILGMVYNILGVIYLWKSSYKIW